MQGSAPRHIFVGNLVLDDIVYPDGRTQMATPGGNSLHAVVGAGIWSDSVGIMALVGRDWPDEYTQILAQKGIATAGLITRKAETMRSWVLYEEDDRRTYVSRNKHVIPLRPSPYSSILPNPEDAIAFSRAARQVQLQMSPTPDRLPKNYRSAETIHLCPMRMGTLLKWSAMDFGNSLIAVDILPYPLAGNLDDPKLLSLLANTDIFMPSDAEAQHLQPDYDPEKLCRQLAHRGPKVVVIKMGKGGAVVYDRRQDKFQHIPCYPTNPVDLTGAGDSYCGGFVVGMMQKGDPFEAALFGAVSASFVIENFGGLHALDIPRVEAEKRLAELRTIIRL